MTDTRNWSLIPSLLGENAFGTVSTVSSNTLMRTINNLSPGAYYLIATDINGCERAIFKKTITALPLPTLDESRAAIIADTCAFKSGRVSGILASSDIAGLQ